MSDNKTSAPDPAVPDEKKERWWDRLPKWAPVVTASILLVGVFGTIGSCAAESYLRGQFDPLNNRIDDAERSLDQRIDQVERSLNNRIGEVERTLDGRIDDISEQLSHISGLLEGRDIVQNSADAPPGEPEEPSEDRVSN